MERTASCPSCRGIIFADDAFCSWCGERVQARAPKSGESSRAQTARAQGGTQRHACESCQSPILREDLYCANCGARCGVESTEQQQADAWAKIPAQIAQSSGGKYEFVRELGRGGMGIVFQARDKELKRNVAIKVLASAWLTDETMVARFQNEARTIASLKHESIVTVFEVRRAGNLHYFVMDYIQGASLSRVLRTHGPLPIPIIYAILYRVGLALSHAHRPKPEVVIHRDVKPSNIMLDPDGNVVVMDFGISKAGERPSGLTSTGLVMGTPEYMSPEQCRGHTVTPQSDQYALGTVLFAMLTGAPPFTGPFYQVLMAHQMEPVPSILKARPDCPPELAAATERMLAKVPGDRWPTILELLKSLGLRPLAPDDPILEQIGELVRAAVLNTTPWPNAPVVPPAPPIPEMDSPTPASITIVPQSDELEVGDEVALKATVLFQNGLQETSGRISWESTNPNIVRVDPSTGQMVAVGTGSAMVKAAGEGVVGTLAVDVGPPRVAHLAIEPRDATIQAGKTVHLRARTKSKHGAGLERSVTWSSSDPRIASVTGEGVVTAKQTGTASILAHSDGVGAAAALTVVGENEALPRPAETAEVLAASKRTATPRLTGTRSRSYARMAVIPAVLAGGALLAWMLLKPPPDIGFAEFSAHVNRGEVVSVLVTDDALHVDVKAADGRSRTYRVSLAGLGMQTILNDLDRRGIPIEAEGEGTVRLRIVTTESGGALPGSLLSLGSDDGAGCDPCDQNAGQVLAAGWYGIGPRETEWRLDTIQVTSAGRSLERLPAGARLFVPNGSTLDVVASLSSTLPVDSGVPPSATLRIATQELPTNTRFSLDGQPLTRTDSVSLVPGQTYRVVAEAQNRRSDTLVITAQVGDTSWTPRLATVAATPPPLPTPSEPTPPARPQWNDTFDSPELAVREFLGALESGGMAGVEGVWSGASAADLQPWRTFLETTRVRASSVTSQTPAIRRGEQAEITVVTVLFTLSSPPNSTDQSQRPLPLTFVFRADGGRWRISRVSFLGFER